MEKYKVKLTILDENDTPQISSTITSELIKDTDKNHNISTLDEILKTLLNQLKLKSNK